MTAEWSHNQVIPEPPQESVISFADNIVAVRYFEGWYVVGDRSPRPYLWEELIADYGFDSEADFVVLKGEM